MFYHYFSCIFLCCSLSSITLPPQFFSFILLFSFFISILSLELLLNFLIRSLLFFKCFSRIKNCLFFLALFFFYLHILSLLYLFQLLICTQIIFLLSFSWVSFLFFFFKLSSLFCVTPDKGFEFQLSHTCPHTHRLTLPLLMTGSRSWDSWSPCVRTWSHFPSLATSSITHTHTYQLGLHRD